MRDGKRKRLGDLLREHKHISPEDLESVLSEQQKTTALLGEMLLQRSLVAKDDLVKALERSDASATSMPALPPSKPPSWN